MADPLSIAGVVLSVGGVIKLLLDVSTGTRDAPTDILDLRNELLIGMFALKGTLELIESRPQSFSHGSQQFFRLLSITQDTIKSLKRSIEEPQSWFGRSTQRLAWHWKKDSVAKHVARIERIKAWLVLAVTTDSLSYSDDILLQMQALSLGIEQDWKAKTVELNEITHTKLLQFLAPIGPEPAHAKALAYHQPGTSSWFTQGPLQQLLNGEEGRGTILWLKGKSGSGKTTLLAYLIEYLKTNCEGSAILSFYCSFDIPTSQDSAKILGSLLAQLSKQTPVIIDDLIPGFQAAESKGQRPSFSATELEGLFIKHSSAVSSIFMVIDAVNESTMRTDLESLVHRLAASCSNVRIFVSSTNGHSFDSNTHVAIFDVEMNVKDVDEDIQVFIEDRLNTDKVLKVFSSNLKQEVRDLVLSRSNGMFRYAQCQMDHLSSQRTGRGVRRALSNMPSNLNGTYERALKNIKENSEDRYLIKRALLWVSYSLRPLQLQELGDAVVVEDGDDNIDDDIRLHDPKILIENSNGLLDYNPATQLVSLSHSSIKTFLTSNWIRNCSVSEFALDDSDGHRDIMRKCLTYLSFSKFSGGYGTILEETINVYPLLGYAAQNWPHHLQDTSLRDWNMISLFFNTRSSEGAGNYGSWLNILTRNTPLAVVQATQPLYYAASFGFTPLVEAILRFDKGMRLEASGGRAGSTPLQVACFRRQKEVVRMLVEAGADPLSRDGSFSDGKGPTSLWWAEANGWTDIVALIKGKVEKSNSSVDGDIIYPIGYMRLVQNAAIQQSYMTIRPQINSADQHRSTAKIATYDLLLSDLEEYLDDRFGKGNFMLDTKDDYYFLTTDEELTEEDLDDIFELRQLSWY